MHDTVQNLFEKGKGILAADASDKTIGKRFLNLGLELNDRTKRSYRKMLFDTPDLENYISGVILYKDSLEFVDVLSSKGIVCGIKVDEGLESFNQTDEMVTKGIETLDARLKDLSKYNLKFAKWRGVFKITDIYPSNDFYTENLNRMAKYAKICQDNNIVPIVEPEVLLEGNHTTTRSAEILDETLKRLFEKLIEQNVDLANLIVKSSMALPGPESGVHAQPLEVANATLRSLRRSIPNEVLGVVFLSGGQTPDQAITNLNEIVKVNNSLVDGKKDWALTFSFDRAIQEEAMKTWNGMDSNISLAQEKFLERVKQSSLATKGEL